MARRSHITAALADEVASKPLPATEETSEKKTARQKTISVERVMPPQAKTLKDRVFQFLRNALTGGLATIVLYMVYLPMVWALGDGYNVLAGRTGLIAGAVVQFLGCRYFVFRAGGGALRRQVLGFIFAELITLGMNVLVLYLAQTFLPESIRTSKFIPLGTTASVFLLFSYPVWHWVFKVQHTAEGIADDVHRQTSKLDKTTVASK